MQEHSDIIGFLRDKERECLIRVRAYDHWLKRLTPARWGAVVVGVVFPAVAGFSVLLNTEGGRTVATWLTFIAAVVAALHAALHCESHQIGCKRMRSRYCSLADEFRLAQTLDEKSLRKKTEELTTKFAKLSESETETPMKWARDKAEQELLQHASVTSTQT